MFWPNVCHICTVDVNNKKKKKKQEQQHRSQNKGPLTVVWMLNIWLQQTNLEAQFFCCCNDITMNSLLSPGPNHASLLLLHQYLPMFPDVLCNWLAGFHWQWHLTFTVTEICVQVKPSIAVRSQMQLQHDHEIHSKLWMKLSTHAQMWAVLGTQRFLALTFSLGSILRVSVWRYISINWIEIRGAHFAVSFYREEVNLSSTRC